MKKAPMDRAELMAGIEARLNELYRLAAKDPRTTRWVRRSYQHHLGAINLNTGMQSGGHPAHERAVALWEARGPQIKLVHARLRDILDRKVWEDRNKHKYGGDLVPSLDWLMESTKASTSDPAEQYEEIIRWFIRPDVYEFRSTEWSSFTTTKKRKNQLEENAKTDKRLERRVKWHLTGSPPEPLRAKAGRSEWRLRINDYPDEPLYTLVVNGKESSSFDNWPEAWDRSELAKRVSESAGHNREVALLGRERE